MPMHMYIHCTRVCTSIVQGYICTSAVQGYCTSAHSKPRSQQAFGLFRFGSISITDLGSYSHSCTFRYWHHSFVGHATPAASPSLLDENTEITKRASFCVWVIITYSPIRGVQRNSKVGEIDKIKSLFDILNKMSQK